MHTSFGLRLVFGCLLALAACSGDDDEGSPADAGAPDAGDASAAGSGGEGTGSGNEGSECESNDDCDTDLSCLQADRDQLDLRVCARPCQKHSECEDEEICDSATGEPSQGMCINVATEPLAPCGPAATAVCDPNENLGCLRIAVDDSRSQGVCLQPCSLSDDKSCPKDFTCLDIRNSGDDDEGLCAHTVARDEVCDEVKGEFCEPGNLCLTDSEGWRCYQDCTESNECDDAKECRELDPGSDQGSYCSE
jgi:hypothetical protein